MTELHPEGALVQVPSSLVYPKETLFKVVDFSPDLGIYRLRRLDTGSISVHEEHRVVAATESNRSYRHLLGKDFPIEEEKGMNQKIRDMYDRLMQDVGEHAPPRDLYRSTGLPRGYSFSPIESATPHLNPIGGSRPDIDGDFPIGARGPIQQYARMLDDIAQALPPTGPSVGLSLERLRAGGYRPRPAGLSPIEEETPPASTEEANAPIEERDPVAFDHDWLDDLF